MVVVRQPGWKLAQHGLGVRDGGDANVVALQGAHERPRAAATALTGRPPATRSRARAAFGGGHALDRLAQDLVFERLLAEQALKLTDLLMGRTQLGGRNHLLAGTGRRQRALRHQPAPGEELVARDAMTPRDERDRVAGQIRLFDGSAPSPPSTSGAAAAPT